MGMYTGIRFKGFVKPEFRAEIKEILTLDGVWKNAHSYFLQEFGKISRSDFIPFGGLCYMPDEWEVGEWLSGIPADGFDGTYNEETGYWAFQCSLKNYEGEIKFFFNIIPNFIEKIEHLEYFYEEDSFSQQYDLVNGVVKMINPRFIKYDNFV